MANPCLTFLLVYAGITLIGLIITSALLATAHTTVVCEGDGEVVEVNHYSVVDFPRMKWLKELKIIANVTVIVEGRRSLLSH